MRFTDTRPAVYFKLMKNHAGDRTNGLPMKAGDIRFFDRDNNQIINDLDKSIIGNSNPAFFGGFFTVTYHGFDLSLYFNYRAGNDV